MLGFRKHLYKSTRLVTHIHIKLHFAWRWSAVIRLSRFIISSSKHLKAEIILKISLRQTKCTLPCQKKKISISLENLWLLAAGIILIHLKDVNIYLCCVPQHFY